MAKRKLATKDAAIDLLTEVFAVVTLDEICKALKKTYSKEQLDELIINLDEISLDKFNLNGKK